MVLKEAIGTLDGLDREDVFFVKKPWGSEAECIVAHLNENLGVPSEIKAAGFAYFLEVPLAREVLDVLKGHPASLEDKVKLLLFYAENDTYPSWVY